MYAVFLIVLFCIAAGVLVGLPVASTLQSYFRNRGRRQVVCPNDHQRAEVEVDPKFALKEAMRGREESRVQTCTHWPEHGECGQECLAQVEATPKNLDRLFKKWFEGKPCTLCSHAITPSDWRQGRLGFLSDEFKLIELPADRFAGTGLRRRAQASAVLGVPSAGEATSIGAGTHRVCRWAEVEGVRAVVSRRSCELAASTPFRFTTTTRVSATESRSFAALRMTNRKGPSVGSWRLVAGGW